MKCLHEDERYNALEFELDFNAYAYMREKKISYQEARKLAIKDMRTEKDMDREMIGDDADFDLGPIGNK